MRVRLAVFATVLLAAGCGGSKTSKPPPHTVVPQPATTTAPPATATAGPVKATLEAATHSPKINLKWRYTVKVSDRRGRLLRGKITVQIVDPLGTAHPAQYDNTKKDITNRPFPGVFRDYLEFPADSRGYKLTVRAIAKTSKGQVTITYPVTPR